MARKHKKGNPGHRGSGNERTWRFPEWVMQVARLAGELAVSAAMKWWK